ncbi:helix-turn-helix transcriptional regulator [Microbacterium tumbae]
MTDADLGQSVRRWRDRVRPDAVGVPAGGRRRAAGLRREELAALSGISVDYLTRIEQGRATSPSIQVIEALARALRLGDAERELMFLLAGQSVPGAGVVSHRIPPSVQRLLDRLTGNPIVVYDAMWNIITANPAYEAISGSGSWRGIERNGVWRNVVGPGPLAALSESEREQQTIGIVADLRLTAARYPHDPRVRKLIADLDRASPRFAELWNSPDLVRPPERSRRKFVEHAGAGRIALDCDTLIVAEEDLRIMIYSAEPGSEDAERLSLAIVLGTQTVVDETA